MEQLFEHLSSHEVKPEDMYVVGWQDSLDLEWNRILKEHGAKIKEVKPVEREMNSGKEHKDNYSCSIKGCNKPATKKIEYNGEDIYLCNHHDINDYIYGTILL